MTKKQKLIVVLMLICATFFGVTIWKMDKPKLADEEHESVEKQEGSGHHKESAKKGSHGGKLFTQNDYSIEVTLFEQGVEPEFRLYTYQDGKPLAPSASTVALTLYRLGRDPQRFAFTQEKDYFKSTAVVEEPHSFKVAMTARHNDKSYAFEYEQVEARITMTDEQAKHNGVEILAAGSARIQNTLQLTGEIGLNEDRTVHIVPRLAGIVESVYANAGDRIKKGQVLAVISSQTLADQRSEWLTAQKRVSLARTSYEREKKLWEEKISAEQDYLQARNTLQEAEIVLHNAQQKLSALGKGVAKNNGNLTRYEIRAPMNGVITQKHVAVGEAIKEDANIFMVTDLSSVWVEATVPAKDVPLLKIGQKTTVKSGTSTAQDQGVVSYIGDVLGEQTRAAKVRIVLSNKQEKWRPGLSVSVELIANEVDVPIAVSVNALQTIRDWNVVFGRYGTFFEARPLELGRRDGAFVEVLNGLKAGEYYASKNSFLIKADLEKSGASHDH